MAQVCRAPCRPLSAAQLQSKKTKNRQSTGKHGERSELGAVQFDSGQRGGSLCVHQKNEAQQTTLSSYVSVIELVGSLSGAVADVPLQSLDTNCFSTAPVMSGVALRYGCCSGTNPAIVNGHVTGRTVVKGEQHGVCVTEKQTRCNSVHWTYTHTRAHRHTQTHRHPHSHCALSWQQLAPEAFTAAVD